MDGEITDEWEVGDVEAGLAELVGAIARRCVGDDDDVPLGEPFERENPRPGKGSVHDAVQ